MGASLRRSAGVVRTSAKSLPKREKIEPTNSVLDSEIESSNEKLLENLKSVYVESKKNVQASDKTDQLLPRERTTPTHDPLHVSEPVDGYLTVQQVVQVLDNHRSNPTDTSSNEVAKRFKLDTKDTQNLLKYFGNFYIRQEEVRNKYELKYHPLHR